MTPTNTKCKMQKSTLCGRGCKGVFVVHGKHRSGEAGGAAVLGTHWRVH